MMKLKFLGAAQTVTGSRYLLSTNTKKILIDCGLFQGYKELRLKNWEPFPFDPKKIDAVTLTHAHIDHSGYLPLLVKQGFRGPIYATPATFDFCRILLLDAARIQEEDARRANRYKYTKHKPALPLYTVEDAEKALQLFEVIPFGKDIELGDVKFIAERSGHILGSAILTFRSKEKTLVFTGDLGRPHDLIMQPPAYITQADYLVLESTYGNRLHSTSDPFVEFADIIRETIERGGTVLIPSFAVARTQVVLYILYTLQKEGRIPQVPIYMDSPMAEDVTPILCKYSDEHRLSSQVCGEVCRLPIYTRTVEESKSINDSPRPKIIISASGMAEGGRVLHHLKYIAPDPNNTIVFVGYQAPKTRGDRIMRGEKEVKIHGEMVPIRAQVKMIDSLSSHGDYEEILSWLSHFIAPPKLVFLTHGELGSAEAMKQVIEKRLGWKVEIPQFLQEVEL